LTFLYADSYEYELLGERKRFKGDKRWFIKCEECYEGEWYPVQEHKAYHFLYDNLEELDFRVQCTAQELRNLIGRQRFIFEHISADGYRFKVSLSTPKPKAQAAPEPSSAEVSKT
jgi:hypothetical protein